MGISRQDEFSVDSADLARGSLLYEGILPGVTEILI